MGGGQEQVRTPRRERQQPPFSLAGQAADVAAHGGRGANGREVLVVVVVVVVVIDAVAAPARKKQLIFLRVLGGGRASRSDDTCVGREAEPAGGGAVGGRKVDAGERRTSRGRGGRGRSAGRGGGPEGSAAVPPAAAVGDAVVAVSSVVVVVITIIVVVDFQWIAVADAGVVRRLAGLNATSGDTRVPRRAGLSTPRARLLFLPLLQSPQLQR